MHSLGQIKWDGKGYVLGCGGHGFRLLARGYYTVLRYFVGHMTDLVNYRLIACSGTELPFYRLPMFAT